MTLKVQPEQGPSDLMILLLLIHRQLQTLFALFTVDDCSPIGSSPTGFCSPPPDRGEVAFKLGLFSMKAPVRRTMPSRRPPTLRTTLFFLRDVAKASM